MCRLRIFVLFLLCGCASTSPRFSQELASTFAQDEMRKLETQDVELYYPAEHEQAAKRVAARASECLKALRAHGVAKQNYGKALLFLSSANYNNAYVNGQSSGEPLHSVNPLSVTTEIFHWYGLGGAEVGDIACHEMFHYAHFEQVHGFWKFVSTVLGPIFPPQNFLERWFTEGVAQYYEGRLGRAVGRPQSPFYRGSFDSFVAMRKGALSPGDLSISQRELNPFSGAYLTGLHFVEWLVERYGEEKLWQLMDIQGRSFFSPFGATLRFKKVYGLSTGALVDEWSKELSTQMVVRHRPDDELQLMSDVGQLARLASHPASGTLAIVSSGNEQVPLLRIVEADGRVRVEQRLARLGTDREWVNVGPGSMSGLSFTADGRFLFLLNDDLISRGDTRAQIWKIDAHTGEVLAVFQDVGRGMGGSVSADGSTFTFVDFPAGKSRIIERELASGVEHVIIDFPIGVSASSPVWNAAHTQLIYSRFDSQGWNIVLRGEDGSSKNLTQDGAFNYGAKWVDDRHILFARTAGRYLQAHQLDIETGELERLSDTPYGLIDPAPTKEGAVAVVRDGIHWSIDTFPNRARERRTLSLTPTEAPSKHVTPALTVESDEPYSSLDHLFIPQLRTPGILFGTQQNGEARTAINSTVSLSLMGRDRLGKHSWAINASLQLPNLINSFQLGYRNYTLAPWALVFNGARSGYLNEAYWLARAYAERSVFAADVHFGAQAEIWQPASHLAQRFIGPIVGVSYSSGDSTAYAGPQRALTLALDVAGYPQFLGSHRDMLDLRMTTSLALPLPFSKRHSLLLNATGRALPGAPAGALRLGGTPSFAPQYSSRNTDVLPPGPSTFLPGTLVENLRGFDDFPLRAQHVAIFEGRYRYRFIIDRGFASLFYILPSLFFRQVELEAFGVAGITEAQIAKGAGAAISLRTSLGGFLPLSLTYQFAYRFDFALPPLHVVGLSFE